MKTSVQKEKPHGKKKKTRGKKNNLTAKEKKNKKCPLGIEEILP